MLQYLVIIGAVVQLLGIASYIKDTLKGTTKPNRVSWLLWSVTPLIATAAALADGVRWAVLPVFMSGFGPLLVFIISFVNKKSYWKLGKFDYLCGFFSVLALVLWGITKEPVIAIIFSIVSDGFAAAPTLVKIWESPESESKGPYATGLFNSMTSFAAVKTWNFSSFGFAAYLTIMNVALVMAFYRRNFFRKKPV
jgi:hypothetical protein